MVVRWLVTCVAWTKETKTREAAAAAAAAAATGMRERAEVKLNRYQQAGKRCCKYIRNRVQAKINTRLDRSKRRDGRLLCSGDKKEERRALVFVPKPGLAASQHSAGSVLEMVGWSMVKLAG